MQSFKELLKQVPASVIYPSPEIYHIGTPSERPTFEVQYLMELHRFHLIQHHLQFRWASTPVQSASAASAGLQSSPGGCLMLEVL